MIKNLLLLSFLSSVIFLLYCGIRKNEYFSEKKNNSERCKYIDNLNRDNSSTILKNKRECVIECNKSKAKCNKQACRDLCNNCNDTRCEWVVNKLKPQKPQIYAEPFYKGLTISMQRPHSNYKITQYKLIVQKQSDPYHKTFYFPINTGRNEIKYNITDLDPRFTYTVYAIATNSFGDSFPSNTIVKKPLETKTNTTVEHELSHESQQVDLNEYKDVLETVLAGKKIHTDKPFEVTVAVDRS
tara:strand:- start:85 stop:810 length:726 start_codon:yes stop_codon:yes gene_type:complete